MTAEEAFLRSRVCGILRTMTLDELNALIDERDAIMRDAKNGAASERERILARTVKLFEEVGELSDEILGSMGWQRQEKLDRKSQESMAEEFADVLITTLLLAKTVGVDVEPAIAKKFEKLRGRDLTNP